MNKKMMALLNKKEQLKAAAEELLAKEGVTKEEIEAKMAEIDTVEASIKALERLDDVDNGEGVIVASIPETDETYKNAFLNAFRGKASAKDIEILNAMTPSTDADGGYIVPKDIQTKINQHKRALPQLETLINVIPVTKPSGTRVYEKLATMTPLSNITDDTADIADMGSPQFENIAYAVKDYAGYMPVPNDLINDSDQSVIDYLAGWIARKSVVTRNSLILTMLGTLTKVAFADWKAVKKAINITLDPMLAADSKIVTNQDGYQYFDTLVDGQGRPLLQPDATQPGGYKLFGKQIVVVPNSVMPTTGTTTKKAPVVIGNFMELMTMFEREGHQVDSTNIGGTAFRKNRTEIRVIEREDLKLIDSAAAVYGEIDVTSVV